MNIRYVSVGWLPELSSVARIVALGMVTLGSISPVQAQSITEAADGTGSVVTVNGNQYEISGGSRSGDGANLFHSFQEFGLSANEIANFLSTSNIQNILGRVVGGNASMIDGLIQVTGGNANLFLMNPTGIIFGSNAQLNVMGDFTATTATGIGFGDNLWFNAFGNNSYETLIGNPSQFAFDLAQSGSIVNEGNLAVGEGQTLTLLGGTVVNTGEITAPGGTITIAAVPGENVVRISQPGQVLSLEFAPPQDGEGRVIPVQLLDLAVLLTGTEGHVSNRGQFSANSSNAGTVNVAGTVVYNQGQITADGENGGCIQIETQNLLDSGILSASGSDGQGGEIQIDYTGTLIQTASALTSVTGTQQGGEIGFYGGEDTVLTTSGSFDATGEVGGSVHLFGQDVRLLAADVDVSGNSGGGEILVGGDFQGNSLNSPHEVGQGGIINAQNTLINHASILRANALTVGNAGIVIVWSDQLTQLAGTIQARGGAVSGDGGFVEVSGKQTLAMTGVVEAGAVNGQAGTLLLDPKNIVIDDTGVPEFPQLFDLVDPNEGGGTGFGQHIVPLSTGNVVVTKPGDNFAAENAGAVYLYNGETGALMSILTGSQVDDRVGREGVVALENGNYVVRSTNWDNGGVVDAGAVTWGDGSTGITGAVTVGNSLVGTQANDSVGARGVVALTNGNYVVRSPNWDNGALQNAGAVTWGDGSTGITGAVTVGNSLVGTQANDSVGIGGVEALTNGNYVVRSTNWDNGALQNAGAVTWGDGSTGITGAVTVGNSLVGTQANDFVGIGGVEALTNGNYVVSSPNWDNGALQNAGAVTWGDGSTGITGAVTVGNSLVGTQANDFVGIGGVTALTNGNYVVSSSNWDNGALQNAGAVTWGDGSTGIIGAVTVGNSLVGTQTGDFVGGRGVEALTNGNYVVSSSNWDNGALQNAGAVTWGDGSTGIIGAVTVGNSLVGTQADDRVGVRGVEALTNGNYLVRSDFWDNGGVVDAGAVTWGNGSTGITGAVAVGNSLVGTQADDSVGSSVEALENGNYLVISPNWDNGALQNAGAVTWGDGSMGITGAVTVGNSLVGTQANDSVGSGGVAALENGNYLVISPNWDNGGVENAGAVTWGDGSTGKTLDIINTINPQNSIVGRTANADLTTVVEDPVNGNFWVSFLGEGSGRVTVTPTNPTLFFDPNLFRFNSDPSATVTLTPSILGETLSAGTNVVLQANNDITVNRAIVSINPNSNGGNLTLQAGRSILVNDNIFTDNGNLTLIANETAANGVVNAFRDPGQAVISIAPGVTLNSGTGDTTLILGTGDGLTNNTSGDITASTITGGNITLINNRGGINTSTGLLRAGSNGNGGTITLQAAGQINTNGIIASGENGQGGTINLNSDSDITTALIDVSGNTNGGNITVNAAGNITTENILSSGITNNGGEIRLTSGDEITTDIISSLSNNTGGAITIQSANSITTDNINANGFNGDGGEIRVISDNGHITAALVTTLGNENGGKISLNAAGNIISNSILSSGGNGDGGTIDLDSGGSITILDESLTIRSGIGSFSGNGNGGNITLNAATTINTGSLPIVSNSAISNGGKISLNSDNGDITVAGINTEGGIAGTGGAVEITTPGFFRATDTFPNLNGTTASISTGGVTAGGTITIRHGGGGVTPLIVGDASTNGTAGAITTGNTLPEQTISPTAEFLYTHTQDGIQIISVPAPGSDPEPPSPPSVPPGSERPSDSPSDAQRDLAFLIGDIISAQTSVNQDPLTGKSSFVWQVPGTGNLDTGRINIPTLLAQNLNDAIPAIDDLFEAEYEDYLGEDIANEEASVETIRNTLKTINAETGTNPVIVYAISLPDQLELVMVVPEGPPIRKTVPPANRTAFREKLTDFYGAVINVTISPASLKNSAQQLYTWMIAPLLKT